MHMVEALACCHAQMLSVRHVVAESCFVLQCCSLCCSVVHCVAVLRFLASKSQIGDIPIDKFMSGLVLAKIVIQINVASLCSFVCVI